MKNRILVGLVAIIGASNVNANMVCSDAYSEVEKSANEVYGPLLASNQAKINKLKSKGLDPCNYYDADTDQDVDYCEIAKTYKAIKDTSIDEAKDEIKCLDNNTEVTAQSILAGMNQISVAMFSVIVGVELPEKAFYVDIADMKEHGVLGGENSLYNKFKDQAQDFKDSLPEIKIDGDTKILDITNRGGTNKHGLPDIKIGGGFKL